jgi:hypothetical protein
LLQTFFQSEHSIMIPIRLGASHLIDKGRGSQYL